MALRITLNPAGSPAEQIREQLHGLIAGGRLFAGERLPSVRQLAHDLGVAPGTVAKAYRELEAQGLLSSRTGAGTRVSEAAASAPREVLEAARGLADAGARASVGLDEAIRVLRGVWHD